MADFVLYQDSKKVSYVGFEVENIHQDSCFLEEDNLEDIPHLPDHPDWGQGS